MTASPDYALIDRAGIGSTIFYPRADISLAPDGAEDLAIEVEPGVRLGARLYAFNRAFPTILYFHGNGEVVGDHDDIAPMYARIGANLLVVDFRGYGRSGGRPSFAALVSDGPAAARAFHGILDERGFGAYRLVMGRSLGAHPALEVAAHARDGFAALIIESGAGNLQRLASRAGQGEDLEELVDRHEAKIGSITLPALFLHGERDELIPVSSAAETFDLIGSERKELVVLDGAGHNDLLWLRPREYFAAIQSFLASLS